MDCPLCQSAHEAEASCPSEPEASRVGQLLGGKYRVRKRIAEGKRTTVYEATHVDVLRVLALKFLRNDERDEAKAVRFRAAAGELGALESEHVPAVVDCGVSSDRVPYMVVEFMRGESLAERLSREPRFEPEAAIDVVLQAARGLRTVHQAGWVHGNLNTQSLFLCRREGLPPLVKVSDLDAASRFEPNGDEKVGPNVYLAPERLEGRDADPRSDVYGLAAILYELLSGTKPFVAQDREGLLEAIRSTPRPRLSARRPALSERLCELVERAMSPDPAQRPVDVGKFAEALSRFSGALDSAADASPATSAGTAQGEAVASAEFRAASTEAEDASISNETSENEAESTEATRVLARSIPIKRVEPGSWLLWGAGAALACFALWTLRPTSSDEFASDEVFSDRAVHAEPTLHSEFAEEPEPNRPEPLPVVAPPSALAPSDATIPNATALGAPDTAASVPTGETAESAGMAEAPGATANPASTRATARTGYLSVNSIPRGIVAVDGRPRGPTPLLRLPVSPGKHTVVVTHEDRGEVSRIVEVAEGESEVVALQFQEPVAAASAAAIDQRCRTNSYVDRDGIRRLKPECLEREVNPYR